jgi:hypothetical protein
MVPGPLKLRLCGPVYVVSSPPPVFFAWMVTLNDVPAVAVEGTVTTKADGDGGDVVALVVAGALTHSEESAVTA